VDEGGHTLAVRPGQIFNLRNEGHEGRLCRLAVGGRAVYRTAQAGGLVFACGFGAFHADMSSAQDIRINRTNCSQEVRIVANHVAASDVLKKLALEMGFQLTLQAPLDSIEHLDSTLTVYELLTGPLNADVIITQRRDPHCPGKFQIARVWVLRKGASGAAAPVVKAGAPRDAVPVLTAPITPEAREQDELYQRAHGMMPELPASATAK
jgi:hypothetical protein